MTTWALVLLISAFLAAPGLAFSGLGPESEDLALDHLSKAELLQDGLMAERWHQFGCGLCKKLLEKVKNLVGDDPSEDSIRDAASRVCSKMGPLKMPCSSFVKRFLRVIVHGIMKDKSPSDVCMELRMCKAPGLI